MLRDCVKVCDQSLRGHKWRYIWQTASVTLYCVHLTARLQTCFKTRRNGVILSCIPPLDRKSLKPLGAQELFDQNIAAVEWQKPKSHLKNGWTSKLETELTMAPFPVGVPLNKTATSSLTSWLRHTVSPTNLLKCSQDEAYTCVPLAPQPCTWKVSRVGWRGGGGWKKKAGARSNRLLQHNVTNKDIKCTYVTSQLLLRRRFSQPPWTHHIPPAHIGSRLLALPGVWAEIFGLASFVFGSVL